MRKIVAIGIAMSNCAAIEIVDDKYRMITDNAENYGIEAYGLKAYWKNNKYFEKQIEESKEYKSINQFLSTEENE